MLYMVVEHFNPGAAPEVYRRARERGRQLPAGLEYVDSWVDLGYARCFQLMRTDDAALFDIWIEAWKDLARFEVIPVRTSAEAARVIASEPSLAVVKATRANAAGAPSGPNDTAAK